MILKTQYSVRFEATFEVSDNATPREIADEIANLNIPEDEISKYVEDTFEPDVLENGNPEVYPIA